MSSPAPQPAARALTPASQLVPRPLKLLTRAQRRNLRALAAYLESLPENYRHFHMARYFDYNEVVSAEQQTRYARHNGGLAAMPCGTVACAVGHGPAAGILMRSGELSYRTVPGGPLLPDWDYYGHQRFCHCDTTPGQLLYNWMFMGRWAHVDNTHLGAAARIRYALANQPLPDYMCGRFSGFAVQYEDPACIRAVYAAYRVSPHPEDESRAAS